jgi:predicted amidophosphoribosyltransferase
VGKDALWPGRRICEELLAVRLGKEILSCLSRVKPVAKSAFAAPGERTSVQKHLESMEVERLLVAPGSITVIDDFVTKGATLIAAASLVKEAFPQAPVRVFALVRTMGLIPDVESIVAPCVGTIRLDGSDVRRDP